MPFEMYQIVGKTIDCRKLFVINGRMKNRAVYKIYIYFVAERLLFMH